MLLVTASCVYAIHSSVAANANAELNAELNNANMSKTIHHNFTLFLLNVRPDREDFLDFHFGNVFAHTKQF